MKANSIVPSRPQNDLNSKQQSSSPIPSFYPSIPPTKPHSPRNSFVGSQRHSAASIGPHDVRLINPIVPQPDLGRPAGAPPYPEL